MSDKNIDQLREGSYDGIQEYDNDLPRWWLATFFLTLVFAVVYWVHFFVFSTGPNQAQEFQQEFSALKAVDQSSQQSADISNASLLALTKDSESVASGKAAFQTYCVACHGMLGEGGIGPNLTDTYWLHGPTPLDMRGTIVNGIPEKGMTPWKGILSETTISQLTAYVVTLAGSNPPNGKAPQGTNEGE